MILQVLKTNRLARITALITSFTILVCIGVGFMIMRLSDKIQDTKVSIKQNSINAYKIEELLTQYQKVEFTSLETIETNKNILAKENIVNLIELMEKTALQNKIIPYLEIEGGGDVGNLKNEIIYNIRFQTKESRMLTYLSDLENIPYVSQVTQFNSNFSMNNNELQKLKNEEEIHNTIQIKREEADQTYALRLKVFLQ